VEVDTARGQVVVYRVPGSGLDAAVCSQVRDVPVELRDALRSAADAQRLAGRISAEVGLGRPGPGFRLFSMAVRPDGTLSFTSDHPEAARRALRGYGPGLVVTAGRPATAL
jgi:hypothetical protein